MILPNNNIAEARVDASTLDVCPKIMDVKTTDLELEQGIPSSTERHAVLCLIVMDIESAPNSVADDSYISASAKERTEGIADLLLDVWSTERKIAGSMLLLATTWWLVALFQFGHQDDQLVILYSLVVFQLCAMVRLLVDCLVKVGRPIRDVTACSHYLHCCFTYITYVALFLVGSEVFLESWSSIFFGSYMFDIWSLLVFWETMRPKYRTFYAIHHTLSFVLVGAWRIPGESWDEPLILCVMIWLSSDLWQHASRVFYYVTNGTMAKRNMFALACITFGLERLQRLAAYFVVFTMSVDHSKTLYFVAASGFCMDVLDTYFQLSSLRRQSQAITHDGTQSHNDL